MEIRGFTLKFSKTKARKRRDESFLQKMINELFIKAEKIKVTDKLYVNLILLKLV